MIGEYGIAGKKYRLLRTIGRGGVSTVYLGEALSDGKRYAIKEINMMNTGGSPKSGPGAGQKQNTEREQKAGPWRNMERERNAGQEQKMERERNAGEKRNPRRKQSDVRGAKQNAREGMWMEIRMQQKLHHPALPHIWEAFEEGGKVYIVMDYVEGIPLDELLRKEGARPLEQALDWGLQLCRALLYLHSFQPPVIYRDMKPANVILRGDGRLVLLDFGAARQYRARKRRDTIPLGTPGYAAPEQYRGRQSDIRTDIYCLGVTLYHILTGHDPGEPPYRICGIREWNRALPPGLDHVIKKCTAEQPWRRYRNCEEVIKALENCRERKGSKIRNFRFFG